MRTLPTKQNQLSENAPADMTTPSTRTRHRSLEANLKRTGITLSGQAKTSLHSFQMPHLPSASTPSSTPKELPPDPAEKDPVEAEPEVKPPPKTKAKAKSEEPVEVVKEVVKEAVKAQKITVTPIRAGPDFGEMMMNALRDVFLFLLGMAFEVLRLLFILVKKPLAILLTFYLIAVATLQVYTAFQSTIINTLSPVCDMPLVSLLDVPLCRNRRASTPNADYPDLMKLQERFEQVLESSAGSSSIALEIKSSETAVRDLNTLASTSLEQYAIRNDTLRHQVGISDLVAKDRLSTKLDDFVSSAKLTSRSLQKLGSRVGGAVDRILAMDEYALKSLEGIERMKIESGKSIFGLVFSPFREPLAARRDKVVETFNQASALMEHNLKGLIIEAEGSLVLLDRLESQLDEIHDIVSRENKGVKEQHDEVLAQLWTTLGGNRRKLANFASHRDLLANIASYRSRALAHVSSTLIQLQQLSADLDDLRERVAQPLLVDEVEIPLEVHVAAIGKGIQRLTDARIKAKDAETEGMMRIMQRYINDAPQIRGT